VEAFGVAVDAVRESIDGCFGLKERRLRNKTFDDSLECWKPCRIMVGIGRRLD
jgi:hypothetical protein